MYHYLNTLINYNTHLLSSNIKIKCFYHITYNDKTCTSFYAKMNFCKYFQIDRSLFVFFAWWNKPILVLDMVLQKMIHKGLYLSVIEDWIYTKISAWKYATLKVGCSNRTVLVLIKLTKFAVALRLRCGSYMYKLFFWHYFIIFC